MLGVDGNLVGLHEVLRDPAFVGMEPSNIHRLPNVKPLESLRVRISELIESEEELLLIYYAGHGLIADDGDLLLTTTVSKWRFAEETSIPWRSLKLKVIASRATTKIVILDCCFSGRANGMGVDESAVLAQLETAGTVVISSSPKNGISDAGDDLRTTFTDGLLKTIRGGVPQGGATLNVQQVFDGAKHQMRLVEAPTPEIMRLGDAAAMPFCNNAAEAGGRITELQAPPQLLRRTVACGHRRSTDCGDPLRTSEWISDAAGGTRTILSASLRTSRRSFGRPWSQSTLRRLRSKLSTPLCFSQRRGSIECSP
nr:hypothetical protein GCM10025732_08610 [Glycomyces mayteni]